MRERGAPIEKERMEGNGMEMKNENVVRERHTRFSYPVDLLTLFTLHVISQLIVGGPILNRANLGSE